MLVVRGTKKLRDRVKGPVAAQGDASTTVLGDWFATALFWKPQVALLVNRATLLPVFTELAPAAGLLTRVPAAIAEVLAAHGVDAGFVETELAGMDELRLAPTDGRSTLGVMNELAFMGSVHHQEGGVRDLVELSLRVAQTPLGPLQHRHGSPDRELAAIANGTLEQGTASPARTRSRPVGQVFQLASPCKA